jgi:hypothetical protein
VLRARSVPVRDKRARKQPAGELVKLGKVMMSKAATQTYKHPHEAALPEQAHRDDGRPPFALDAEQRHEGQDAALAVVVDAHRDRHVFDRGDHDEGPDDERQRPERDARVGPLAGQREDGLERVERARADVAEHDAERREGRERKGGCRGFARTAVGFRQEWPPLVATCSLAKLKRRLGWVNETRRPARRGPQHL